MEATPVQVPETETLAETQPEIIENPEPTPEIVEKSEATQDGLDGVYKRDEYCKAQFWDDRFKG